MKTLIKKTQLFFVFLMSIGIGLNAQNTLIESDFTVAGTSTLHDWTMTTKSASSSSSMEISDAGLEIKSFTLSIRAESLKSGKTTMDDIAYDALKSKKNPNIQFKLSNVSSITKSGNTYNIQAKGILTIAGKSCNVNITGKASINNNQIKIYGSKTIKMTDFDMEPPTAMFGTIKTGDTITINYNLTFRTN